MKHFWTCTAIFFVTTGGMYSQKIKVTDGTADLSGGKHPCIVALIFESTVSDVEKGWKSELKTLSPEKVSNKGGEIFADNATLSSISSNPFDIYAKGEKDGENQVKFLVAFDLGVEFLSPVKHSGQYKSAERIVYDFAVKMTRQGYLEKLKDAQRELDKRKRKFDQIVRDKERLQQDIDRYKTQIMQAEGNISRAQEEIKNNEKSQGDAQLLIEEQEKAVQGISEKERAVE